MGCAKVEKARGHVASMAAAEAAKLRQKFRQLDVDNSGALDFEECKALLEKMGRGTFIGQAFEDIFTDMDADGDGLIQLLEFENWYYRQVDNDQKLITKSERGKKVSSIALRAGANVGSYAVKRSLKAAGITLKERKGTTEFDGETEAQVQKRSVRSGWAVHVSRTVHNQCMPRLLALAVDGLHVLAGNTESSDGPARELAWLDITNQGSMDDPVTIEIGRGTAVRGMVPQIIRLGGSHDLLEDPDPDYEDFEFAVDQNELMFEWVAALKICGATPSDYTERCHVKFLAKQKRTNQNKKAQKLVANMQARYDKFIKQMEDENDARRGLEEQEKQSKYRQMEWQLVDDYDAGEIKLSKKCPCGSGEKFENCHFIKIDQIRASRDESNAKIAAEKQRKEDERRSFEEGLVDLYLADLIGPKEMCPCGSGKQFKKCHYISLNLQDFEKAHKDSERYRERMQRREEKSAAKAEQKLQKEIANAPKKLLLAETKRLQKEEKEHDKQFKRKLKGLFKKLDVDGSGSLNAEEIRKGLAEIKFMADDAIATQLWKDATIKGMDVEMTVKEFVEFLMPAKPKFVPKMLMSQTSIDYESQDDGAD
eukprot:SAG31_NODE_750_length_12362_cov_6.912827_9_plen_595_part_00